ncbi:tetratricopeptide repeat protein [Microcoleus sp. bin38.metabat.b11b12b14.051]|uniref:tetratricopeptide repeat protein n=1 Tax=Microcoleus sp. bin38.metabat.b11b12b14.051 TaxID=2742709 RepID=UPI0025FB2552|nr:tetratricopeptide repeat protein [Microcoleus sp. bin38.metabat.b11b12b14.051]
MNFDRRLAAASISVTAIILIPQPQVAYAKSAEPIAVQLESNYRVDLSVQVVGELVAIDPKAEDFYNQGVDKYNKGDFKGAVEAYDRAIELNPNYTIAYSNGGSIRYQLGDKQGALADFDRALKIDPNNASAYYNRGTTRSTLKDKQGAMQDFQKAADLFQKQGNTELYQNALNRIRELQDTTSTP